MASRRSDSRAVLDIGGQRGTYYSLKSRSSERELARLPFALRILLENLLRHEDGSSVRAEDIAALVAWRADGPEEREIAFRPARVLLQDFTGVPALVDLAAMRDTVAELGGDPARLNPLRPAELVIDHSVQVDSYGSPDAVERNAAREYERNRERYVFLRWGQKSFENFRVVPPDTGIVHQVNLEHLARVVFAEDHEGTRVLFPDTLVGTDSHTTMVNGLGVLGWGVGGIEAEAALLGQPITMLLPEVVGVRLDGRLPAGTTATDLVLVLTQKLRALGVVGKFVEFFGPGLSALPVADRATLGNMSPEFGSTCALFPIDRATIDYLRLTGRSEDHVALVEAYARAQGLWHDEHTPAPEYSAVLELDLAAVEPSLAGPSRPQDRVPLDAVASTVRKACASTKKDAAKTDHQPVRVTVDGRGSEIGDGAVVIAAITSCTNTSNPSVMVGAGLLARKAAARGLRTAAHVKTSLAPGSQVVTRYLEEAGLLKDLEAVGFYTVGYGCTTCIGNSGPLPEAVSRAVRDHKLTVGAVLSGNRNFEGRIHPEVRLNFLASPPLVVAYALVGRLDVDLTREPLGTDRDGRPVHLADLWPDDREIADIIASHLHRNLFDEVYARVFEGTERWRALEVPEGTRYRWDESSSYVRRPPFLIDVPREPRPLEPVRGARVLALLGDSVTTDHISPAGSFAPDSPAGRYLQSLGIAPKDFNSYGARRGNHEVMMRGTFANVRLRNALVPGVEGGITVHLPDGEKMSIYDAAMRYREEGVPLLVIAGKEYGSGSSRDWAAKGPALLGVRAVLAESFERIHRSNLIGMGVLPLQFRPGENASSLGLDGHESYDFPSAIDDDTDEIEIVVHGKEKRHIRARVRLDTPMERMYHRHGGILPYVLRQKL
jgi:aconitate hydratase